MKEKYTITITEKGIKLEIKKGDPFHILAMLCTVMKDVVEVVPVSVCKDKDDQKNLVKACCKAVEECIDAEKEEVPHVHQTLPHLRQS